MGEPAAHSAVLGVHGTSHTAGIRGIGAGLFGVSLPKIARWRGNLANRSAVSWDRSDPLVFQYIFCSTYDEKVLGY